MKCSYCTREIEKGTGLTYVRRNGSIRYYCSNRCFRFNIKHDRRAGKKEIAERSVR